MMHAADLAAGPSSDGTGAASRIARGHGRGGMARAAPVGSTPAARPHDPRRPTTNGAPPLPPANSTAAEIRRRAAITIGGLFAGPGLAGARAPERPILALGSSNRCSRTSPAARRGVQRHIVGRRPNAHLGEPPHHRRRSAPTRARSREGEVAPDPRVPESAAAAKLLAGPAHPPAPPSTGFFLRQRSRQQNERDAGRPGRSGRARKVRERPPSDRRRT